MLFQETKMLGRKGVVTEGSQVKEVAGDQSTGTFYTDHHLHMELAQKQQHTPLQNQNLVSVSSDLFHFNVA